MNKLNSGLLNNRINKSVDRLCDENYSSEKVFQNYNYEWQGDWEGRALLAFMCIYEIDKDLANGQNIIMEGLKTRLNSHLYFGENIDFNCIDEQQLSGNSWFLRGICEHYEKFNDKFSYQIIESIINNLIMPLSGLYSSYPINREKSDKGGVSGNSDKVVNGWKLSTDTGCAFIALDGFSHAYKVSKNNDLLDAIDKIITAFVSIDMVALQAQTHATLTACRGIIRMYECTLNNKYLQIVTDIFDKYISLGMTLNYANYNWFNRYSWTEPCAIVDSLVLAIKLFNVTNKNSYLVLAHKIYNNAFRFAQRFNGGAGTDSCVDIDHPILSTQSCYEAVFCCTMRILEGFREIFSEQYKIENDTLKILFLENSSATFLDNKLSIKLETNYPATGDIKIIIDNNSDIRRLQMYVPSGITNIKCDSDYELKDNFIFLEAKTTQISYEIPLQTINVDNKKIYFYGDYILGKIIENESTILQLDVPFYKIIIDNMTLCPIINHINLPYEISCTAKQQLIF